MRTSAKRYCIEEYGSFTRGVSLPGYVTLPDRVFDALESFILVSSIDKVDYAGDFFAISARRGVGRIITARNYVGVIRMKDGSVIEILPKIVGENVTEERAKQVLLRMLSSLNDIRFKSFSVAKLDVARYNIFEIFISMYLNEAHLLVEQGLKSAYESFEDNQTYYRGKLLAPQNLRLNMFNRERFYLRFDQFSINCPENKLIKSTLRLLFQTSTNHRNRQLATRLLHYFDAIDYSHNYAKDFAECVIDRGMELYERLLTWSRVFLLGDSFGTYSGREISIALLYPMEYLFERFVSLRLKSQSQQDYHVLTQDTRYSLYDTPRRSFGLRPDIVMEAEDRTIVIDTKWKILSDNQANRGITQADMYQMYVYAKKYQAKKVILVYPETDLIRDREIIYEALDDVRVEMYFVNLLDPDVSITNIVSSL